ncbi:MAG: hypothetical protein PHE12_03820 [Clostridia bacterium]|nr:hypothetical protein [Clostridia bacterium]
MFRYELGITFSEKVGFNIANYFIKTFKKYTGVTPSKYKRLKKLLHFNKIIIRASQF